MFPSAARFPLSLCCLALPLPAFGQTKLDPDDVVVTAKRARGSAIDAALPIAVIDSTALYALGATSMSDLMKRLKGAGTSASGAEPALLLNGRRVAGYGDLNGIPPEAIERVEVLSEQDAARFGFPPTVRVMNFLTKKHFRSVAIQELPGLTTEGGGGTDYTDVNAARIEGARRTTLDLYYFRQDPVRQNQRAIVPDPGSLYAVSGNVVGSNGGSIDPALDILAGRPVTTASLPADAASRASLLSYAAPGQAITDIGRYRTLQQSTDTFRADGTFAAPLSRSVDGSLNLSAQADRNAGLNGLAPGVLTIPAGALAFAGPVLLYRYFPDAVLHQRSTALTLHAGATVQGGKRWGWSVTASYDRVLSHARVETGVPIEALQAAIDAGGDPLAPLDPASAAQRFVSRSRTRTDTVATKAVVNGSPFHLPAGDAQVTVSADYARSASATSSDGAAAGIAAVSRSIGGVSVNTTLPIASPEVLPFLHQLALSATLGVADVSRYGRLVSSNAALSWAPAAPVQIVASVDETRTAPAIAQLVNPNVTTPNVPFFDFTTGKSVLVSTLTGGNPALAPERRRTTTIGLSLQPWQERELRLNLAWLDSRMEGLATTLGSVTPAFQAAFPDQFVRDAAGELIRVDLRPVNLARERERKLRMTLNFQTALGRAPPPAKDAPSPPPPKKRPTVFVNITANYRLDDRLTLRDGTPALDLLDGATLDGTGGRPRWDLDGTIAGGYGPVNVGLYGRMQGQTRIRSDIAASDLRFSGRTWLVAYASVDVATMVHKPWAKQLSLQFTIENLLNDRIGVRDRTGATPNRFQSAYLDPIGRSVRIGVRKLF